MTLKELVHQVGMKEVSEEMGLSYSALANKLSGTHKFTDKEKARIHRIVRKLALNQIKGTREYLKLNGQHLYMFDFALDLKGMKGEDKVVNKYIDDLIKDVMALGARVGKLDKYQKGEISEL